MHIPALVKINGAKKTDALPKTVVAILFKYQDYYVFLPGTSAEYATPLFIPSTEDLETDAANVERILMRRQIDYRALDVETESIGLLPIVDLRIRLVTVALKRDQFRKFKEEGYLPVTPTVLVQLAASNIIFAILAQKI